MGKLIKYEFRKTMFSKLVILAITAVAEVLFLIGVLGKWDNFIAIGITGLVMCAMIGIFYIGIESLIVFHKDLNTKQSYMLFLTPHSSHTILGSKIMENAMAIFAAGCFFALLAALDISFALIYMGGLKEALEFVRQLATQFRLNVDVTATQAFIGLMAVLASWLMMIVNGDLAIVISSTYLSGKKLSGLVSFILYLLIGSAASWLLNLAPQMKMIELQMGIQITGSLILTIVFYLLACWIMDKKLSV